MSQQAISVHRNDRCECGFLKGQEHVCCGNHPCCDHHEEAGIRHRALNVIEEKKEGIVVAAGALFLAFGLVAEHIFHEEVLSVMAFLLSYGILVFEVAKEAIEGFREKDIFNENLLMLVASVGAMAISNYPEGIAVILLYRIGEMFEDMAVERNRSEIARVADMRPETVELLVNDHTRTIMADDVRIGDIIVIKPGERIPLDGMILEGSTLVDTSPVTGEPVPVRRIEGESIISGCINETGVIKMRVEKTLEESMVTRIIEAVERAAASKPKVDRFITRFAAVYTPAVMAAALAVAVIPSLVTGNWSYWVYTALTFLVISCPCAIVISIPLAFFSGIGAGSRKGILFKGGSVLEAMKDVAAVVFDKTGTITKGEFAVRKIEVFGEYSEEDLLAICAGCETFSSHPIAESIMRRTRETEIQPVNVTDIEEHAGKGISGIYEGRKVLCGTREFLRGAGVRVVESEKNGTEVEIAIDGVHAGRIIIYDAVKSEAVRVIRSLKKAGMKTVMLTGDEEKSAMRIGTETGMDEVYAGLLPEDKLTRMQELRTRLGKVMFVGDGINDAPVLAGADVGAAMGSGADAAIEAADLLLMTSDLETIEESFKIAKKTTRVSAENIIFALGFKAIVMILGLAGFASMWLAVIADTGVAMACILNSIRVLYGRSS